MQVMNERPNHRRIDSIEILANGNFAFSNLFTRQTTEILWSGSKILRVDAAIGCPKYLINSFESNVCEVLMIEDIQLFKVLIRSKHLTKAYQ